MQGWERASEDVEIPGEGMTLDAYVAAIRVSPLFADEVVRHLHRKKLIWMSVRRGHARIFPASHRPARGRPPAVDVKLPVLIDPRLFGLFTDVGPAAVNIAVLKSNTPSGGWMDQPQLQAEIRRSIAVEAGNVMAVFRRFMDANAIQVGLVRKFLWLVFPAVMPIVIETQPELEQGDAPLAKKLIPVPKRVAANLPDEERVFSYIQKAGPAGIAAYEIVRTTAGVLKRERVEEVGTMLEQGGLIFSAMARTSDRGRKGLRYFAAEFGEPQVGSDGRVLPKLGVVT
ncbi:hypothetical protein CQ13_06425 [Bradyrhizobium retamae]|uniref:Uncharacterized protein n=2 Tax=Bradyrhizobium retamae TaxID=1300035 RepID=A0A0R3MN87_9BRAD|nr:hypothetical protein CQ13_06425 [Bradyrhizobium retamae]